MSCLNLFNERLSHNNINKIIIFINLLTFITYTKNYMATNFYFRYSLVINMVFITVCYMYITIPSYILRYQGKC